MTSFYLVADIGGTNARINLYEYSEGTSKMLVRKTYPSQEFTHLVDIINRFLAYLSKNSFANPDLACLSLTGIVENGSASMTNLGWTVTIEEIKNECGIDKVYFLNDFEACGYGLAVLDQKDMVAITKTTKGKNRRPKIILGVGTGLGESILFWSDGQYKVYPTEGGHKDFAPKNEIEFELLLFAKKYLNLRRIGVERIISGTGIDLIYEFLAEREPSMVNPEVYNMIKTGDRPGSIVIELSVSKKDKLCIQALFMFISIFGAEIGNFAINVIPYGGIYIAGGIIPRIIDQIKEYGILNSFLDKGRMRGVLEKIPIYVITNTDIGILGAKYMAQGKLKNLHKKSIKRSITWESLFHNRRRDILLFVLICVILGFGYLNIGKKLFW